jgi:cell filamentation protein
MNRLFPSLKTPAFVAGNGAEAFVAAAAEFLSTLNAIHPFREGNGRSQLSFLHLIALRAGHPLRLENIQQEAFLDAMIRSFDGPNDLLIAQLRSLLS